MRDEKGREGKQNELLVPVDVSVYSHGLEARIRPSGTIPVRKISAALSLSRSYLAESSEAASSRGEAGGEEGERAPILECSMARYRSSWKLTPLSTL